MNFIKGIRNISYSFIGQLISMALGIFIPRLVIVSYGSDVNGLLSSIGQVMTYLALLEAGLGSAAVQALYKPIAEKKVDEISAIVSAANYSYKKIGYIYLILVVGISFVFPFIIHSDMDYWFVWVLFLINGLPGVINFLFQGKLRILMNSEGDGYVITNLSTILTVFTSITKIVMLLLNMNIVFIQLVYCGTSLIQMVFIYSYVKKHYPWLDMKHEPNYKALEGRNPAFLHEICGLVTNSTDVMLLSFFCNLESVSIYSVYNMIYNLVYNVVSSINSNIQFMLGQAFYKGKDSYCRIIDAYETFYISFASALMLITYRLITPFLTLYTAGADVDYINNAFPLMFFLVKILHSFKMISITTGSISGHFEGTKWHAIVESGINLVVSVLAVNRYGMVGVLLGTIISFLFRLIASTIYTNNKILNRNCWHTIKTVTVNGVLVAVIWIVTSFISFASENYLSLLLKAVPLSIGVLAFFALTNALCSKCDFETAKDYITNIMKNRKNANNA